MKAHKLADVQTGADSLGILLDGLHGPDWIPEGNGSAMTDQEYRDWQDRELEKYHASVEAKRELHLRSHLTLMKVTRILREFALSPVTMSSLQPVLDLAAELNPSLKDELDITERQPF